MFYLCRNSFGLISSQANSQQIYTMPYFAPKWQYALSYDWWGDMPQWMHDFLDGLSDDETEGILYDEHSPGLLRWRYDIQAKKQYCEERWHDDEEWVPTKVREIRRSLVPDPKPA